MPAHKNIDYDEIHAVGYVQNVDPGAIGAGRAWIDTSTNPAILYIRNANDDGWWTPNLTFVIASTDTAPVDDSTPKKVTLQRRASPPSNAAYIEFVNNPAGGNKFYLVVEEA